MIGYIYKITNINTGRFYIGKREKPFFDKDYWGSNRELLIDIHRQGKENFKREIIAKAKCKKELQKREILLIKKYKAIELGYNKTKGGEGMTLEERETILEEDVEVGSVYSTTDYEQFSHIEGNRKINENHVARIMKEFEKIGQLSPIIVNQDLEVVDGQHRLEACKRAQMPVYYIVVKSDSIEAILSINNVNRKWKIMDYIHNYSVLGEEDYTTLLSHYEEYEGTLYHIPILTLVSFMSGQTNCTKSPGVHNKVKDGHFKIHNIDGFLELFGMYKAVVDKIKVTKSIPREISIPLFTLMSHKNFDLLRFLDKLNEVNVSTTIIQNWGNTDHGEVFVSLANMYNRGLSKDSKNTIQWRSEERFEGGLPKTDFFAVPENLATKFYCSAR